MKTCRKCFINKNRYEFRQNLKIKDGMHSYCLSCETINKKDYKKSEKGKLSEKKYAMSAYKLRPERREQMLKCSLRKFGINIDYFNKMFSDQNGCCAICNMHQSEFKKRFCVDHDHFSGKVRALLCHYCNLGLGHFKDDIAIISRSIEYLNKHKKGSVI